MTREEIVEILNMMKGAWMMVNDTPKDREAAAFGVKALDAAISALKGPTREQVEKVWKGKWEPGNPICPICGKDKFDGLDADIWADWMPNFCPHCGSPLTDKAVETIMKRMEEMRND